MTGYTREERDRGRGEVGAVLGGLGRMLMVVGGAIFVVGLVLTLFGRTGLGRLPGDVVVQRGGFTFYFPIVTSILLSLLLTGVFWILRR